MSGAEPRPRRPRRPSAAELERKRLAAEQEAREELEQGERDERQELGELRGLAIRVFLALSVAVVLLDAGGRLFRDPAFRIDPLVFGMVFGTLLALLGLEATNKLLGGGK